LPFLSTRQFWQLKVSQPPVHDMVLAGNSRIFLGLWPRQMAKYLSVRSIYNFSFVGCSLERPYLEHAARLLNHRSHSPSLVVGVSPHSLMRQTKSNHSLGYLHWSNRHLPKREEVLRRIRRDNLSGLALARSLARNLFFLTKGHPLACYFLDGWEASVPLRKEKEGYAHWMEEVYQKQPVDWALLDDLFKMVSEFQSAGIKVYGFRPPGDEAMRRIENLKSGLDFTRLPRRFEAAGGKWLKVDETGFPTYDGVHMDFGTAIRFSRHLAGLIAQAERKGA